MCLVESLAMRPSIAKLDLSDCEVSHKVPVQYFAEYCQWCIPTYYTSCSSNYMRYNIACRCITPSVARASEVSSVSRLGRPTAAGPAWGGRHGGGAQ